MRRTRRVHGHLSIMASFSVKSFERKLKEMSSRQDSVQTVSLWLIHHRAHSKAVVNLWLEHMKKAKPDRRLVLFYLANDVIQNSRKKGKEFSQSFNKVLGDSMQYLRDTSIQPSVERVLKIWQERKVFDSHTVQKLLEQLNHVSKPKSKPKSKHEVTAIKNKNDKTEKEKEKKTKPPQRPIPANFKMINVTRAIATMQSFEDESERRQTLVTQMRLDASSSEGIKQLKDYAGGNRFSLEFEESSTKYEDLVQSLESESQQRQIVINLLEDGNAYYEAALKEANIIANAYRSFGNRLHSMKKKLDNKIRKFATAEKEAPVSAPKASFLASGLSGILEEMNRSPAATRNTSEQKEDETEKEGENEEEVKEEVNEMPDEAKVDVKDDKIVDPTVDHVEVSDMDIDSDSENGGDDSEPSAAPQLSDTQSNTSSMSTPKPTPAVSTASPTAKPNVPAQSTTPQFGYTMTANSTEDTEASSPASHDSAPSPEGSPDLNLEIYEGPPATNTQLGVMTNQSFLAGGNNEQKSSTGSPGPQTTMTLLAQLISKKRRQNDGSSVDGTDSPDQDSSTPNTPVRDEGTGRPLMNLLGNLFPKINQSVHLVSQPGDTTLQKEVSKSGDSKNQEVLKAQEVTGSNSGTVAPNSGNVESEPLAELASKVDSGPSTDEEGAGGDTTPEHGLEFAQGPPIIMRSDGSFPRPPIHSNIPAPFPGQAFQDRPPIGRLPFVPPQRMPRFPNDPGMPMRDGLRRPSMEEQLMEEQHLREMRSPGLRSPRMKGPPIEWDRRLPFGPRGNVMPVNNLGESRDPRLRRREQQMSGRPVEGSPFMDRVPPIDMRSRPPGMEMRGGPGLDRGGPPPMGIREDIRREELDYVNREEIMRRRPSYGDEEDGSVPFNERHIREMRQGRPPVEVRPELHLMEGERREGPFPFERHEQAHPMEMRDRFHPMERGVPHHIDSRDGPLPFERREGPHHMELRDGPPHMRGEMIPSMNRHHPPYHVDRPDLPVTERRDFHPFDPRGPSTDQLSDPQVMDHRNEFHPPKMQDGLPQGEVPTSEEIPRDESGTKPPVGTLAQEQNPAEEFFSEGGDERPPVEASPMEQPQMDNPEDSLHNEAKFNHGEATRNEQPSGPMFPSGVRPTPSEVRPSDERSTFDIRPGFHMDERNPGIRPPGRRDDFRPMRPMGGPFGPHHERPGRYPGPRNFHHRNFGPRNFRPRHEHEGGWPRFPPMHGGPRQKRPGPSFYPDSAKRPHY